MSGPWSPTPCRLVRARVTSLHDCIVSMQALAFAGSFHFAKSGPPPSLSRCSITGSRTRAQQVEWCRCTVHVHVYTSRSDRLLFRLAALRPSEGPQRSALVGLRVVAGHEVRPRAGRPEGGLSDLQPREGQQAAHARGAPQAFSFHSSTHTSASTFHQEYIRTRVGNSILWGLSRQNSKFVINDAQPLSFQVVMHSTLNTCMLALSRSSIFLTGISGWACTLHARVRQSTVLNVGFNARG